MKIELGFQLQGDNNDLAVFLPNLLHAADLGSTARRPPLYYDWMQRVFQVRCTCSGGPGWDICSLLFGTGCWQEIIGKRFFSFL